MRSVVLQPEWWSPYTGERVARPVSRRRIGPLVTTAAEATNPEEETE
jgi:hypothetical protein